MEEKKEKKTIGQKLDDLLAKPRNWAEKHPKVTGTLKFLGATAFGFGLAIGLDKGTEALGIGTDDDEDAIETDATEIPIESVESDDSGTSEE